MRLDRSLSASAIIRQSKSLSCSLRVEASTRRTDMISPEVSMILIL
jgi:hypothetical protein